MAHLLVIAVLIGEHLDCNIKKEMRCGELTFKQEMTLVENMFVEIALIENTRQNIQ